MCGRGQGVQVGREGKGGEEGVFGGDIFVLVVQCALEAAMTVVMLLVLFSIPVPGSTHGKRASAFHPHRAAPPHITPASRPPPLLVVFHPPSCALRANTQVRRAESVAPPPPSRQELKLLGWTPPVVTQLRALSGRALRDVARDPYLATLHVVLTPLMGLLVGTLFGDLRRDNSETAGIQVGQQLRS